ncbi:hypothetical protein J0A94_03730 [Paraclostridium bifermentans]|uniref:Uncharacterized protein n=1 Tax=Paraclostridium bifermentans TaxID=1490 RepID=A0AA44DJQ6_PARBF|nr:ABC-three component system middle component 7 [Paraclostridium bifermentans]MBN8046926.1 hypothetical protein [Paraclostridium bifermentans]NME09002.1 hypothetical protein [Paraclostridium bifermentans]
MIVPNKIINYKQSIIYKMIKIMEFENSKNLKINDLYIKCSNYYDGIDEFIYSLETLYLLDKIDIDFDKGEIIYVKRD